MRSAQHYCRGHGSCFVYCACRKAYRLGKWLSDLNTLRNTPVLTKAGSLEVLASGGEGVYYFVEQLTWYVLQLLLLLVPTLLLLMSSLFVLYCWSPNNSKLCHTVIVLAYYIVLSFLPLISFLCVQLYCYSLMLAKRMSRALSAMLMQAGEGRATGQEVCQTIQHNQCLGRAYRLCGQCHTEQLAHCCSCREGAHAHKGTGQKEKGGTNPHKIHIHVQSYGMYILHAQMCCMHKSPWSAPAAWLCLARASLCKQPCNLSAPAALQEDATLPDDVHLIKEVQDLRARRLLRTLAVVQDLSDALTAINDVTGSIIYFHNTA